jgi:hypothetical protein
LGHPTANSVGSWGRDMWARIVGLSFVFAGVMGLNASWSAEIKFDGKNYADNMDLAVGIAGTMKVAATEVNS